MVNQQHRLTMGAECSNHSPALNSGLVQEHQRQDCPHTVFLPCLKSVVLRSKSSVSSSLGSSGAAVVEDVTSGRNVVLMVVVVVVVVVVVLGVVVISGDVSGNLEVDVPVSERPVVL